MSLPKDCPIGPQRKRKPPKANLEGHVVRECMQFLGRHPSVLYVERRNTGAVQFQGGGFLRFGAKGAADIWCLVKIPLSEMIVSEYEDQPPVFRKSESYMVRHVEIECKRSDGKGRQSPEQQKFQEFCDNHGIPYILTTSVSDLEKKIDKILLD